MAPRTKTIPDIDSVSTAVRFAEKMFPKRLCILESATRSARSSSYRHPLRVAHVLALLAFFGRDVTCFRHALETSLSGRASWRPKESPETITKFGHERCWTDTRGDRRIYESHVTLGGGEVERGCLQIYYGIAPDGRVEIPWVGRHRKTVSQDT